MFRYPVKSMLGEALDSMLVDERGAEGDRRLALVDAVTGRWPREASRLWRALLTFTASGGPGRCGSSCRREQCARRRAGHRRAALRAAGPTGPAGRRAGAGAAVERPAPEDVLEQGVEAEVEYATLEIARAPGQLFPRYARCT